jgi:uncharacterized protein YcbK (DUF882 family)
MNPQRRALILGGGAFLTTAALASSAKVAPWTASAAAPATPAAAAAMPAPTVMTRPAADARRLFLHNLHTGDTVKTVYWANGEYIDGALDEARRALRDWRNGAQHDMDPGLFDIFHELSTRLEADRPFQIISGYRSPATNAKLHARSSGVAKNSLHTRGMATDIRVEGVELRHLQRAALDLGRGGVGFYPASNFVHVDTGQDGLLAAIQLDVLRKAHEGWMPAFMGE